MWSNRCTKNCGPLTSVAETVELRLDSTYSNEAEELHFRWQMIPDIDWEQDSGTGNSRRLLGISDHVLQAGATYMVQAHGQSRPAWKLLSSATHGVVD